MREEESDRFFGRSAEIAELVERFRRHRIVAIVADSGTGKSSLARAGFIRAFRGGALIDPMREGAREKICQVVTMRPGADPAAGLRQGLTEAAERLGRSLDDAGETAFCATVRTAVVEDLDAADRRPVRRTVHDDTRRARRALRQALCWRRQTALGMSAC